MIDLDAIEARNAARLALKEKARQHPTGFRSGFEINAAIAAVRNDPVEADVAALVEEVRRLREELSKRACQFGAMNHDLRAES